MASNKKPVHERGSAARFGKLDFHDDSLKFVRIHPGVKRGVGGRVDFSFADYTTKKAKSISFRECANLRCILDFDVLADNWFAQTEGVDCINDAKRMEKFVRAQVAHWHVRYMPPTPKDRPIRRKIASIRRYHLFRVRFFGGTFEVLAKRYLVRK